VPVTGECHDGSYDCLTDCCCLGHEINGNMGMGRYEDAYTILD